MLQLIEEKRKPVVNVIPPTKRSMEIGGQIKMQKSLRVAAYCRVSTEDDSQQTSYITQKAFYTQMITRHPGWRLAGIYADEAISGTSRSKRKDFNRMMDDAQNGKLDYIVTKSISRFARNTVDTLDCVRQLRMLNPPVGIFFEKENIDTLDATGELILTILSALAQDESRSISDNIRWSIQRKFQRGEAIVDLSRMLGYDKGPDGEWVINKEQAEVVRYIFEHFVRGESSNCIARKLNEMGKRTVRGNIWRADAVLFILRNEKYVGDLEMQKTITKNFLTHRSTRNMGEAPKYYVKDHHIGIIDRFTWDKVQLMLENGKKSGDEEIQTKKASCSSPFFNLTYCVDGYSEKMFRLGYNCSLHSYTDERSVSAEGLDPAKYKERYYFYYPVWRCSKNVQSNKGKCFSGSIYECALEQSFMEMLYRLKRDYDEKGNNSLIVTLFREACERIDRQTGKNSCSIQRLEILDLQICELEKSLSKTMVKQIEAEHYASIRKDTNFEKDWISDAAEEVSEASFYAGLAEDIQQRICQLKKERSLLEAEQGVSSVLRKNFNFFIRCLKELPEKNLAGMRINVNGLDLKGDVSKDLNIKRKTGKTENRCNEFQNINEETISKSPDFLHFEKGIYIAFIKNGLVKGDEVEYVTNFGVKLISRGNRRTLGSFLGFRRANPDGTVDILDEKWKVSGRRVCYTRKEIKID